MFIGCIKWEGPGSFEKPLPVPPEVQEKIVAAICKHVPGIEPKPQKEKAG